jgi:subtilisin family serine protease
LLVIRRPFSRLLPSLLAFAVTLAACGGGGGGGSSTPASNPTATPTPGDTVIIPVSTTGPVTGSFGPIGAGYTGTATVPAGNVATNLTATFAATQPGNTPTIQNLRRRPKNIGGSNISALAFLSVTPAATVTFASYPSFTLVVPASLAASIGPYAYIALYSPTQPNSGWTTVEGPASVSGGTLTFTGGAPGPTLIGGDTYVLLFFTVTSLLPTPTPVPSPTPTATPDAAAYICPTNDQTLAVGRGITSRGEGPRRFVRSRDRGTPASATNLLAVTYAASTVQRGAASIAQRETATGASLVRELTLSHLGHVLHVLSVPAGRVASVEASLRAQPGVLSVAPTGARRRTTTVTAPHWTNDPYFAGFTATQNAAASNPAPSTYETLPYAESAVVPGQWDMHAISLGYAFEYSQPGNGSGITNANALGSASVKIAVIDTGEDPNHPELSSKVAYQKCYISGPNPPYTQSSSDFETDPMGHGTDVSGIAAADTNNSLGFTGAGGNVVIYGYRVFPTPDDTCVSDSGDDQCDASTTDIASAIDDAVTQHVNVISMSLGGGSCTNGVDDDPTEGAAVAEAIAANVVVVAAAGNSYGPPVEAPACDTGVIAVGATSLADGAANPNGTGNSLGTPTVPVEYVASYTDYGLAGTDTLHNPSSWGIVAPGGDPSSDTDNDDLHWIENIWTSTPYMSSSNDTSFEGECTDDYPTSSGTTPPLDCRTLIAGTSMATPHVAGAAALILSVNAAYQSPTAMRQLLCQTADTINDANQGCGRLNVYRAMATALADPVLP